MHMHIIKRNRGRNLTNIIIKVDSSFYEKMFTLLELKSLAQGFWKDMLFMLLL
jgi:hypothetical protein